MRYSCCLLCVLLVLPSLAAADYTRVLGVSPARNGASMGIEIALDNGAALSGLRWFNNDASQVFPKVVIVEGQAGQAPDLTNPGLVLAEVAGVSSGWGELLLESPVTSSTGTAFAVFFFPENEMVTGLGQGGGPALGIGETSEPAPPFYLSGDGVHWARFDAGYELGAEPVYAALRGTVSTIKDIGVQIDLPAPEGPESPVRYVTALSAPCPNPFNPRVQLSYSLESAGMVRLKVYDVRGRLVKTLLAENRPLGNHTTVWNGVDQHGRQVASGVYFARFEAGSTVQVQRMVLLR